MKHVALTLLFLKSFGFIFSQGTWIKKTDLPGATRFGAAAFAIGSKGYVGTGQGYNSGWIYLADFWEWDKASNAWTQKANFPGAARRCAVAMAINNKGYLGTGSTGIATLQDWWEFDPVANNWTSKAAFPDSSREYAVGFSIGGFGYLTTGLGANNTEFSGFWRYDPSLDSWQQMGQFSGSRRSGPAIAMAINGKGYVGTGIRSNSIYYNDFWEWNPATNAWTQLANFGGTARGEAACFSIYNTGFVGTGTTQLGQNCVADFWRFDATSNTWTPAGNFGGGIREFASAFTIDCKGYVTCGFINDQFSTLKRDLWEFTPNPDPCNTLNISAAATDIDCYGNCNGTAWVNSSAGWPPYSYLWNNGQTTSSISGLCAGSYPVQVMDSLGYIANAVATVTQPPPIIVSSSTTPTACKSGTGTGSFITNGGTPGYTYQWGNGLTTQTGTGLSAGTYSCLITDANGCTKTATLSINIVTSGNIGIVASPQSIYSGDETNLLASGGASYSWTPTEGLSCDTCATTIAAPTITTTYCAYGPDPNGCPAQGCITIEVKCKNIFVPNAFSPNNDGENDLFKIYGDCIEEIEMKVFNRWGELVFRSDKIGEAWNGTHRGEKAPIEVYVYFIHLKMKDGEKRRLRGNVSLLR